MTHPADKILRRDITIPANTTWAKAWKFQVNGVAFFGSDSVAKAQVRDRAGGDLLAELTAQVSDQGILTISVLPATSQVWAWTDGFYDVNLTKPGGQKVRLVEGKVKVSRAVTV